MSFHTARVIRVGCHRAGPSGQCPKCAVCDRVHTAPQTDAMCHGTTRDSRSAANKRGDSTDACRAERQERSKPWCATSAGLVVPTGHRIDKSSRAFDLDQVQPAPSLLSACTLMTPTSLGELRCQSTAAWRSFSSPHLLSSQPLRWLNGRAGSQMLIVPEWITTHSIFGADRERAGIAACQTIAAALGHLFDPESRDLAHVAG